MEGIKHDSAMLTMSNFCNWLVWYSRKANGEALSIYVDPAYPLRLQLQDAFKNQNITPQQAYFKKLMSTYFCILDYKKNLKIELIVVAKIYCVCAC